KSEYKKLNKVIKEQLKKFGSFEILINGFIVSRGGWLGLNIKSSFRLTQLRRQLFQVIAAQNFQVRKLKSPFHPHITLTRYYSDKNAEKAIQKQSKPWIKIAVK